MNYGESASDNANGWESLLNSFASDNNNTNGGGGGSDSATPPAPTAIGGTSRGEGTTYGEYSAYLQATYQLNTNNQGQTDNASGVVTAGGGSPFGAGLNYHHSHSHHGASNSGGSGYSLNMPAQQGESQYIPGSAAAAANINNNRRYEYVSQDDYNQELLNLQQEATNQAANNNNNDNDNYDPYSIDYGNQNTDVTAAEGGGASRTGAGAANTNSFHAAMHQIQPTPINNANAAAAGTNTNGGNGGGGDMDYCDALLRGMDDSSFNWLAGALGTSSNNNNNNAANSTSRNNNTYNNSHLHGYGEMQFHQPTNGGFLGGEHMALPTVAPPPQHPQHQHHHMGINHNEFNALLASQQQLYQEQQQQQAYHTRGGRGRGSSSRSKSATTGRPRGRPRKNKNAPLVSSSISSTSHLGPTGRDHSSLPSYQIDPLLEKVTLTVSAVSLTPLSGNEVVRHIRTKTDDVITRFLPCVDFLVNCQQELRQGLQIAQRSQRVNSRSHSHHGRARNAGGGMTPRQFHATYVAPLPKRFERTNQGLMEKEHLRQAKVAMEELVRSANADIPQGCDQVKNTFLGGMRENESWGLRKWLSKHGGAGSICNDLEEVIRHVKSLKKEDETTIRLARMLRPIAKQAHERLKKDVPQAYQEQSTAHPYLPFFHRLEACLKQMSTYDPEDDDVILLDDSSDEEDPIKVVSKSPAKVASNSVGGAKQQRAPPIKKRHSVKQKPLPLKRASPKRKSDNDISTDDSDGASKFDNETNKRSRSTANDDNNIKEKEEEKQKSPGKRKEVEVICLDDSSDEEDENDTTTPATTAAATKQQTIDDSAQIIAAAALESTSTAAEMAWRCDQCTFLNEAFSSKCIMCNDDDDVGGSGGGDNSSSDELAKFLSGSSWK